MITVIITVAIIVKNLRVANNCGSQYLRLSHEPSLSPEVRHTFSKDSNNVNKDAITDLTSSNEENTSGLARKLIPVMQKLKSANLFSAPSLIACWQVFTNS
jgi:hypothetical protein